MASSLPDGILVRAPTLEDLQLVVDLVNACSVAEGSAADFTAQRLLESWGDDDFGLASDAWVAVAPGGQLAGYEELDVGSAGRPIVLDGYVHPAFKGRGIGTYLLRAAEARGRQAAAAAGREPIRLRATIESANQAAQQLFAAEGYTAIRHFWRMEIELNEPPQAPEWPAAIRIRPFVRGQDERATHAALQEAFADHWEFRPVPFEDWERLLIQRDDFDPALWFLALDGNEVAGAALCFDSVEGRGWIRSLGVRPRWRRRGLALALLRQAFGAFYRRGRPQVGLGVDSQSLTGATRLYERAGMRVTERYDTCEKIAQLEEGV